MHFGRDADAEGLGHLLQGIRLFGGSKPCRNKILNPRQGALWQNCHDRRLQNSSALIRAPS